MINLSNDTIVQIQTKEVDYIQYRRLQKEKELVHAFTMSTKGFDIGGNTSFFEKKEECIHSYQVLAKQLQIPYQTILRPYQTHTDVIKTVEAMPRDEGIFPKELQEVDGLITQQKGVYLSLSYADCMALLLYDPNKKVVANIHSGWKGTVQRIGIKAVLTMLQEGSHPEDIICCIGPSIRKCHFEVEQEVVELFQKAYQEKLIPVLEKGREVEGKQKYTIDTVALTISLLEEIGLKKENIIDSQVCTVCHREYFHSYRAQGKNAGRNTAIIGLR